MSIINSFPEKITNEIILQIFSRKNFLKYAICLWWFCNMRLALPFYIWESRCRETEAERSMSLEEPRLQLHATLQLQRIMRISKLSVSLYIDAPASSLKKNYLPCDTIIWHNWPYVWYSSHSPPITFFTK